MTRYNNSEWWVITPTILEQVGKYARLHLIPFMSFSKGLKTNRKVKINMPLIFPCVGINKMHLQNTLPPQPKSEKAIFSAKVSQGHKVMKFVVIQKGIISGVCMQNMTFLSLTVQKL